MGSTRYTCKRGRCAKVPRVDLLSQPTRILVQRAVRSTRYSGRLRHGSEELGVEYLSRPTRSLVRADTGSTSSPGPFGQAFELARLRSAVPAHSDPGRRSCGDDQLSRATLPGFVLTRGRPVIPANTVPYPRSCAVHQRSRPTRTRVQGVVGSISCPVQIGSESDEL